MYIANVYSKSEGISFASSQRGIQVTMGFEKSFSESQTKHGCGCVNTGVYVSAIRDRVAFEFVSI